MPHPETSHCLNDDRIRQFVDETPDAIPAPRQAQGLAIGENLVLAFRDTDAPNRIAVEIRGNPEAGSSTKGKPILRLVCSNRPDKIRRNVLLACEKAYIESLRTMTQGRSFCNSDPDPAMKPGSLVMTKLTPGQEPPPEATRTLEMFTSMDFDVMAMDQYQVMGLGRYRMGVRRDLDRPRWFVVQLVDSHGDRVITESKMAESELRDSMRQAAAEAMDLTMRDAA